MSITVREISRLMRISELIAVEGTEQEKVQPIIFNEKRKIIVQSPDV